MSLWTNFRRPAYRRGTYLKGGKVLKLENCCRGNTRKCFTKFLNVIIATIKIKSMNTILCQFVMMAFQEFSALENKTFRKEYLSLYNYRERAFAASKAEFEDVLCCSLFLSHKIDQQHIRRLVGLEAHLFGIHTLQYCKY